MALNDTKGAGLADRLKTAAEAKQAQLAKFKPKPAVADPLFAERGVEAAAELKAVRAERQAVRKDRKAAADAVAAEAAPRAERKRAKIPTEAEAKEKRDAKYAARKSRR